MTIYQTADDRRISRAIEALTQREMQVLDLISFGNTGKTVAKELKISPRTVEVYRQRALDKLGARNTVDMVRMFVQHRIRSEYLLAAQEEALALAQHAERRPARTAWRALEETLA